MSYAQAFNLLHVVAGKPTIRCIQPRSAWTVSTRYTWDPNVDRYVDINGIPWEPTTASLPYDDVNILPPAGSELFELTAGGVVDAGSKTVRILAADRATVEAAEFVLVDSLEYRVTESTPNVTGNPTGYTVRMVKR
jgi:hypothetical protein